MKTQKAFHFVVLFAVAIAPLFFPAPAEAVIGPWVKITSPVSFKGNAGPYSDYSWEVVSCAGLVLSWSPPNPPGPGSDIYLELLPGIIFKSVTVTLTDPGEETISDCSGYCGCESSKPSYCSNFSIPSRVPRSPAILVTFKGLGNITHANIYSKVWASAFPCGYITMIGAASSGMAT